MIRLEPVTERTFRAVVDMRLGEEQNKFVAPNVVSLAQAWLYYEEASPFAVCDGDTPVGFLMLDMDQAERTVGVWRFMIAPEHQGKGYGRQAMEAALALAREAGVYDAMYLDYVPGNDVARALYASLGFRENGKVEDGEIVMTLRLTDAPRLGFLTADEDDADDILALAAAATDAPFTDADALRNAVGDARVQRLTLYGETVGLVWDGELLLSGAALPYRAETESLARA